MKKFLRVFLLATLMISMITACGKKVEEQKVEEAKKEIKFSQVIEELKSQDRDSFSSTRLNLAFEIDIAPDDKSMTITTSSIPHTSAEETDRALISELNEMLGFNSGLDTKMEMTKIEDGKQSFTSNGVSVTWWVTKAFIGNYWHYLYEVTE